MLLVRSYVCLCHRSIVCLLLVCLWLVRLVVCFSVPSFVCSSLVCLFVRLINCLFACLSILLLVFVFVRGCGAGGDP